jgi:hypothetical protein
LSAVVTVVARTWGTNDTHVADFGFVDQFEIGDVVWHEAQERRDGVFNTTLDAPIANVTLALWTVSGTAPLATTTTGVNGRWRLNSLRQRLQPLTNYRLEIDVAQPSLAGLEPTLANAGANDTIDSDGVLSADGQRVQWSFTTPNYGGLDLSLDSGWLRRFYLGNSIFLDRNGDGLQGGNDPGIGGVQVQLFDLNGTRVAQTVTNVNGTYRFDSLRHRLDETREYVLLVDRQQTSLDGLSHTRANVNGPGAGGDSNDSDGVWRAQLIDAALAPVYANFSDADSIVVSRVSPTRHGVDNTTLDFGFVERVSFGDYVWRDIDRNGRQDVGEPAIANVTIELRDRKLFVC